MRLRALCCLPLLSALSSIACGPPVDALRPCMQDSDCLAGAVCASDQTCYSPIGGAGPGGDPNADHWISLLWTQTSLMGKFSYAPGSTTRVLRDGMTMPGQPDGAGNLLYVGAPGDFAPHTYQLEATLAATGEATHSEIATVQGAPAPTAVWRSPSSATLAAPGVDCATASAFKWERVGGLTNAGNAVSITLTMIDGACVDAAAVDSYNYMYRYTASHDVVTAVSAWTTLVADP